MMGKYSVSELWPPWGSKKSIMYLTYCNCADAWWIRAWRHSFIISVMWPFTLLDTHLGNIWAKSLSVFCLSTSSSSVLSLIRSSKLDEYCSNMRSIESMMLVFFPLVMFLNCHKNRDVISPYCIRRSRSWSKRVFTCLKISSKVGLFSGSSLQHCFMTCITSTGASSTDITGRHNGGGSLTLLMISVNTHKRSRPYRQEHTDMRHKQKTLNKKIQLNCL